MSENPGPEQQPVATDHVQAYADRMREGALPQPPATVEVDGILRSGQHRVRLAAGVPMYPDMDAVRIAAASSRFSLKWFNEEHMRGMSTRLGRTVYDAGPHGAFFVVSTQPDPALKRRYTVHHIDADGEIRPVDGDAEVLPGINMSHLARSEEADRKAAMAAAAAKAKPAPEAPRV